MVKRLLAATAIGFAGCSLSNQDAPALIKALSAVALAHASLTVSVAAK